MLARWYLLLGQFSVTFEYRPGAQHANADGMSCQCGQCQQPDCPVSATDSPVPDAEPEKGLIDQPLASSQMGESMDADLLPELSGETWVASALLEEFTADLLLAGADLDLIAASRQDVTLATVRECIQSDSIPVWAEGAGLSPELRCWRLQVGNLSIDTDGRSWRRRAPPSVGSQLVVPQSERQSMIRRFHDSLLRVIWEFLGRCFAFRPVCTGPDYDRTFERMWHLTQEGWSVREGQPSWAQCIQLSEIVLFAPKTPPTIFHPIFKKVTNP